MGCWEGAGRLEPFSRTQGIKIETFSFSCNYLFCPILTWPMYWCYVTVLDTLYYGKFFLVSTQLIWRTSSYGVRSIQQWRNKALIFGFIVLKEHYNFIFILKISSLFTFFSTDLNGFFLRKKIFLKIRFTVCPRRSDPYYLVGYYWALYVLPQIYTKNHATFPIQIDANTVLICGNFWGTQYIKQWPILNSRVLYKTGHHFLDIQYTRFCSCC